MTGLVHESPVSSLVLPVLMRPILSGLERQDQGASQTLRAALHVLPSPALAAQVVALPALVDQGPRGSHLLLAVRTHQLRQDLVLQTDGTNLVMRNFTVKSSTSLQRLSLLSLLSPFSVLLFPFFLLTEDLGLACGQIL